MLMKFIVLTRREVTFTNDDSEYTHFVHRWDRKKFDSFDAATTYGMEKLGQQIDDQNDIIVDNFVIGQIGDAGLEMLYWSGVPLPTSDVANIHYE